MRQGWEIGTFGRERGKSWGKEMRQVRAKCVQGMLEFTAGWTQRGGGTPRGPGHPKGPKGLDHLLWGIGNYGEIFRRENDIAHPTLIPSPICCHFPAWNALSYTISMSWLYFKVYLQSMELFSVALSCTNLHLLWNYITQFLHVTHFDFHYFQPFVVT